MDTGVSAGLSKVVLQNENVRFLGTGGRSEENRSAGFRPAFLDEETRIVYPSRFVDGMLAPFHLLDGLPDDLVVSRHPSGRVARVKPSVISGFVRDARFYTRDEAASWLADTSG